MSDNLLPIVAVALLLVPMFLLIGLVLLWNWLQRRRKRRSPLTSELLRPPGYGCAEKLDALRWDVGGYLMAAIWAPSTLLALFLLQHGVGEPMNRPPLIATGLVYGGSGLLLFAVLAVLIVRVLGRIRAYRDGRDGELATAQLLEPVIAGGGRVLHDIQGDGFNVDHAVVAPGGIFAIETKHRMKPTTGRGADNAKVRFDGRALRFPDWTDTRTAEQAAAQARWLGERLSRATGLPVQARPIIALPGWYVDNTAKTEVFAINPKNCQFMLKPYAGRSPLDAETIQRIAHQLEQLCRLPDSRPST